MNNVPAATGQADDGFTEVMSLIQAARQRAFQAVNTALIDLYWQIGEHISRKIATAEWGAGVVAQLATHIAKAYPGLRASSGLPCSSASCSTRQMSRQR